MLKNWHISGGLIKKNKKRLLSKVVIILTVLLIFTGICLYSYNRYYEIKGLKNQYQNEKKYYKEIRENEQKWIAAIQLSNGALPFREASDNKAEIVPYFGNLAALSLINSYTKEIDQKMITSYMDWYLSHLNSAEEDLFGIDGTIYDYSVVTEKNTVIIEISKHSYDSVDSYAATFISLIYEYYQKTGDKDYLLRNEMNILRVIRALVSTIEDDGLSIVKADYPVKYLMDNSEVNMGLTNAIQLLNQVYLDNGNIQDLNNETIQVLKEKLETLITKNTESIEQQLWNSNESRYEVGLNNANEVIAFKGWNNFYPDAVAQLFPAIFEVESSNKKRNLFLYEKFCAHYEWQNFGHFDSGEANFYWPIIAYAAAIMEDEKRVKSYFINFENRTMGEHPYPVYITDSGWLIRSCEIMEKFYDKRMENLDPFDLVQ